MSILDDVGSAVDGTIDRVGKLMDLQLQYQVNRQNAGLTESRNQPADIAGRTASRQNLGSGATNSVATFGDWVKQNQLMAGLLALGAGLLAYAVIK